MKNILNTIKKAFDPTSNSKEHDTLNLIMGTVLCASMFILIISTLI